MSISSSFAYVGLIKFYIGEIKMTLRILLDTNVIIHREANTVINKNIGTLFNWIDKLKYEKYIHPLTKEEILQLLSGKS